MLYIIFHFSNSHFPFVIPFSTKTRIHIHSGYCLVVLYSFRNLCGDKNSEDSGY
ncbi:hypothetical protein E2C01_030861 [Portunus trituberculatus]|uniref:Uncharacterized protein n=1 Tax=Portunus trituberculatus TaxID=210409 RepID=A0A5B7EW18_PORTR|nr:hypothetical protein [Portunus trituberculatus]